MGKDTCERRHEFLTAGESAFGTMNTGTGNTDLGIVFAFESRIQNTSSTVRPSKTIQLNAQLKLKDTVFENIVTS